MKKTIILLAIPVLLFSCKRTTKDKLTGTWRATSLVNHQMDTVMMQSQQFIDTLGKSTDTVANTQLYGTSNIDSLRKSLQGQLDSIKKMQDAAVKGTVFEFRKDGTALLSFSGKKDSTKWSLEDDSTLVLDELKEKGAGDNVKMQILQLTDTALQLRFMENNSNSIVTFHPEGK